MIYYRFEARSTTPGQRRLTSAACVHLFGEQLVTDQAAVSAGKADILNTRTILTVTGTFDDVADDAAVAAASRSMFEV